MFQNLSLQFATLTMLLIRISSLLIWERLVRVLIILLGPVLALTHIKEHQNWLYDLEHIQLSNREPIASTHWTTMGQMVRQVV